VSDDATARSPWGGFAHPAPIAAVASAGLLASYVVAVQDAVPDWELRLTEWINDAPDAVATLLYPIMQAGTLGGPIVVAASIAAFKRDWLLSGATVVAGLVAWFGAKGVKQIVERDRPLTYLPEVAIREGDGTGLGYVSGHSAVAATAAIMAMAALPRRWRPLPAVVAVLVGIARIVHGVHLPADVIGGWSFGVLIALGTLGIVDVVDRRPTQEAA
jgi:membrane-associated phospholipid phosphatase